MASTDDPQWQKTFEAVYVAPSLQVPWYVALGNHDYLGNCDAQIAYGRLSKRWNMPARYFTVTRQIDAATAVDLFFLDTTPMVRSYWHEPVYREHVRTQDVPKQLAWFEAALAASTAPWKLSSGITRSIPAAARWDMATPVNSSKMSCRCSNNIGCRPTSTATTTTCSICRSAR